jgi:hypothetical protein
MRHDNIDFLKSIPSMASAEKRVWYFAKYCDTQWAMDPDLISNEDLEQNVPAITIANNPAVLGWLLPDLYAQVMDPTNLITYDAEKLARALRDPSVLNFQLLVQRSAVRIIQLLWEQKIRGFINPISVALGGNAKVVRHFMQYAECKPTEDHLQLAIALDWKDGLLLLLEWTNEVPSDIIIGNLITRDRLDALQCIHKFSPDWVPSQDQFDTAFANAHLKMIEWFKSINVALTPSPLALKKAVKTGRSAVITWYLTKYDSKHSEQIILMLSLKNSLIDI